MVAPKLLMLKEYLELDHDDDDGLVLGGGGGGGGVVTVRSLLDAELREKTDGAVRDAAAAATGNGNALGKFSAAIEAVKRRAAFSVLSWKKRKKQRPAAAEQNHRFPSPDTAAAEAKEEYSPSENEEEEEEEEATIATPSPATEFQGKVKEEEEEEGFYRSLDYIERAAEQMLHRIRRFEMLAEVDPAAECCSRSSDGDCEEEEEEERAWELLGRLKTNPPPRGGEKLLLDFFIQGGKGGGGGGGGGGLPLRQRPRQGATTTTKEMLRAARRWIDGRPGEEAAEPDSGHGEAATLREMERDGRWRCFHEEEEELGLQVGDQMIQSLVEDIVKELA